MDSSFDVIVMGSGAAGLTAALAAAALGAKVLVLEKTSTFGGTTAISGGQLWVPNNRFLGGGKDTEASAREYLAEVTLGQVDEGLIDAFIHHAPSMVGALEDLSPLRFSQVHRFDYHSEWPGAQYGRSLEPLPVSTATLGDMAVKLRRSPYRLALTSAEAKAGYGAELDADRRAAGEVTQGVALIAGLLSGCLHHGVALRTDCRVGDVMLAGEGRLLVTASAGEETLRFVAHSLIIASGGFEWNRMLVDAFLPRVSTLPLSPPSNEGDGLRMALAAGAAVDNMGEAWWSAAFAVPDERYDGRSLGRNIVKELALPGSILVNKGGERFANEAASYNVLGKAFLHFDPRRNCYVNERAWLVFDEQFKRSYAVATVPAIAEAPDWWHQAGTLEQLANSCGISPLGLQQTVSRFNALVDGRCDTDFFRGTARHDRYHGDTESGHPNLGKIGRPPFYAVPIALGNLGTKGGIKTDVEGRVVRMDGTPMPRVFACGNAAASWMGPGYPGAGGSLGPIMTAAYLCGHAAASIHPMTIN